MGHTPKRIAVNTVAGWISNITKVVIQLVMLPVMAHLLGPAEFGLYALALPTVSLFLVLADGGLGLSLAREDETAVDVWSTAFWLLLATGAGLTMIVTGWGYVLALLTSEPRLFGLMAFLSLSFPLITLSVLPSARLTRRGNLVVYAFTDAISTLVGAVVAFGLAEAGAGAWSLAGQYVCVYLIRAIVFNAVAFSMPARRFEFAKLRPHISTGSAVLGSRLSDFASRLVENLLFGRMFGTVGLGNYTFANQTSRFLSEAASNPLWAALYAQALHESAERIAPLHAKLSRILALITFPASFLLSASAPQILALVLGPKWSSAVLLLQIVVPTYALAAVATQSGAVLLANGRNAILFWSVAGNGIGRVFAVCLGYWTGLIGVAVGIALSNVIYAAVMFEAPSRLTRAKPWSLLGGLVAPTVASVFAASVCYTTLMLRPGGLMSIIVALMLSGVAYLIVLVLLDGRRLRADLSVVERMLLRRAVGSVKRS